MSKKIFLIGVVLLLLVSLVFVFARDLEATVTLPQIPTQPTLEGQSVVYYMKMLNSKIFSSSIASGDIIFDSKLKSETTKDSINISQSGSEGRNSNSENKVTWVGIRAKQASIIFPPVESKVNGTKGQLSMVYARGKVLGSFDWGERFVSVMNNGLVVTCYDRAMSVTKLNNSVWGSQTSLYLMPFESEDSCNNPSVLVDNLPLVNIVANKGDGVDSVEITSPLIPDVCNGKTFDNVYSNSNKLTITKEMCEKAS